jgi:hypothetical protein
MLASHNRGPGSGPGQSMWDLWWTKWHWESFFCKLFGFPVSIIPPLPHIHSHIIWGQPSSTATQSPPFTMITILHASGHSLLSPNLYSALRHMHKSNTIILCFPLICLCAKNFLYASVDDNNTLPLSLLIRSQGCRPGAIVRISRFNIYVTFIFSFLQDVPKQCADYTLEMALF